MIWLFGCADPAPPPLDAPVLEDRWAAFLALDLDDFRAQAPALLRRLHEEPDPALRNEIIREIGLTGDAEVRAALIPMLDGDLAPLAAESLSFDRPAGCDVLADRWMTGRKVADYTTFVSGGLGETLLAVFERVSPACRPALRARAPDDAARLDGEPEWEAHWYAIRAPTAAPVPAANAAEILDAAGIWTATSGTWRTAATLVLVDGTELAVHAPDPALPDGTAVVVDGIPIPVAPVGDPDPRGRIVEVRSIRAR